MAKLFFRNKGEIKIPSVKEPKGGCYLQTYLKCWLRMFVKQELMKEVTSEHQEGRKKKTKRKKYEYIQKTISS